MKGVLGFDYHLGRKSQKSLIYRLGKRTEKVLAVISEFFPRPKKILDLGAAEGLMLSKIKDRITESDCLGVEYSRELIAANRDDRIKIVQADVLNLPLQVKKQKFDVIIAAALIEHLEDPEKLAAITYQVLSENGILIVTTPVPFFEKLATMIGHLPSEGHHQQLFNLQKLEAIFNRHRFRLLKKEKFMFSPVGFPFERQIEEILRRVGLNFLMANQLMVLGR